MVSKLKVNMLGSGNVATHLAMALNDAGHTVCGIYSRQKAHAEELAGRLKQSSRSERDVCAVDNLSALPVADVYAFAVRDAVLTDLAERLRSSLPEAVCRNALFLHTAGSMPIEVLSQRFALSAVMYPLQTFSKTAALDFGLVPLFVEGNCPQSEQAVMEIAHSISCKVTHLDGDGRKRIHLAGVFANNFTNHMCQVACDLLQDSGIDPTCLLPILDETVRKLHTMPPRQAQTGPAVRWDRNVMDMHRRMLDGQPALQQIYEDISQSIHQTVMSHDQLRPDKN